MRRSSQLLLFIALFAGLWILGSVHPVWASTTPSEVPVRVGEHPSFDRLVFDWPMAVTYAFDQNGGDVRITFSAAGKTLYKPEALSNLGRLKNFASSLNTDGHTVVTFHVDASEKVKVFANDNSIVIDITSPEKTSLKTAPSHPAASPSANVVAKPPSHVADVSPKSEGKAVVMSPSASPANPLIAAPNATSASPATSTPLAEEAAVLPTPPALSSPLPPTPPLPKPVLTPPPSAESNPSGAASPPISTPIPTSVTGSKSNTGIVTLPASPVPSQNDVLALPVPSSAVTQEITNPLAPSKSETKEALPAANMEPTPQQAPTHEVVRGLAPEEISDAPLLAFSLDPHVSTRAVIFTRAGFAYVVFDRKITLSLVALTQGLPGPRVSLEPLDMAHSTGYRFPISSDITMHATRVGTVWQVYLSRHAQDIPVSTTLVAQPDFALGSRFLLPLPDAPDPIRMTDPVIGDDLILVPLSQNEAFSIARNMADFNILPAAQGLVIKPLTDKIIVRAVTDGIEITAEGGLNLSSAVDTGSSQQSSQKAREAEAGKSIFDFAAWRGKPDETFIETRQRLEQTIVDVPEAERNRSRLELARFYFAHGNGEEALALLNFMAKQIPDLMAHADFLALLGASEILAHRPEEAVKHLDIASLKSQPEIELWLAVAAAELRLWKDSEEKFSITEPMLYGYPEPFHSRFAVLAVESALATDKDREAADWLNQIESVSHQDEIEPAIRYAHAVLHAKAGRAQAAEAAWKDVAASDDRLYKVRAEMALVDLGVSTGSLTPVQAADRLEGLRFAWRGDDLEVDILHRLGQFYIQAKNIKAGLNTLSQATQLYPTSPLTPQIHSEMSTIFHDVFLSNLGANLSPLDALTLYQQYRSLMPTGKDGDAVTRNLAERLVAVDLLDQAASLLEEMVKNRLQGEERARVSTRLAAIRLLDHKPELALSSLDLSNGDFLPADVQNDRLLLRAKALSELHRDDEALALLHDNTHESAKLLRADITMHAKHWDDAAKSLLELIGPPPKAGEVLRKDQAEWLVNCAIALSLAGNTSSLDKLAIDYGAAMAGTSLSSTFRILTAPEKTTQLRDITAAQARIADVDMFQGFLNSYRKAETPSGKSAAEKKP